MRSRLSLTNFHRRNHMCLGFEADHHAFQHGGVESSLLSMGNCNKFTGCNVTWD